jgi:hypothetical protein
LLFRTVERLIVSGKRGRRRDIMVATGETDEINEDRAENAIAANFVHAADAALLHLVALEAAKKSMPMLSIHDCFATTAPFAAELNAAVRDCFARLHRRYNCLNIILQAARKILPKDVAMPPRLKLSDHDPKRSQIQSVLYQLTDSQNFEGLIWTTFQRKLNFNSYCKTPPSTDC